MREPTVEFEAPRTNDAGSLRSLRIIEIHDAARAHQPRRPPGLDPARGEVVVGLPLAGRPLQTLI